MSKELKSFDRIKNYQVITDYEKDEVKTIDELLPNSCKEVETALKEKEQQDNVLKILKEVIEFSTILPHIKPNKNNGFDIMSAVGINIQRDIENKERELLRKWILETCFPKELKALEIIKNKLMYELEPFDFMDYDTYEDYYQNYFEQRYEDENDYPDWWLTKDEFELLKDVFGKKYQNI